MTLYYSHPQQTFQEVPGEITLALSISGCNLKCKGCHSTETFPPTYGSELTTDELSKLLKKFRHTSCVLFYGGEWNLPCLVELVNFVKESGLKCCLYTGRNLSFFPDTFIHTLDFIKVGAYIEKKGNLQSPNTNQRFYEIKEGNLSDKTALFYK